MAPKSNGGSATLVVALLKDFKYCFLSKPNLLSSGSSGIHSGSPRADYKKMLFAFYQITGINSINRPH